MAGDIFEALIKKYPTDSYFYAHAARFYAHAARFYAYTGRNFELANIPQTMAIGIAF